MEEKKVDKDDEKKEDEEAEKKEEEEDAVNVFEQLENDENKLAQEVDKDTDQDEE